MAIRRPGSVDPGAGLGYQTPAARPVGLLTQPPASGVQIGAFTVPPAPRQADMTTSTTTRFIEIDYNGNIIVSQVTSMNFTGPGVIVSNVGSAVTINIPGSNGTPTGPNNSVQYNSVGTLAGSSGLTFNPASGNLSVTSNVHASYFVGDATRLFNIPGANIVGQIPYAESANTANTATTATTASTVTTAAQPAITSVGTLTSVTTTGVVSATGNIVGGNIRTTGLVSSTGSILAGNNLSAAGNVTGVLNVFAGNIGAIGTITGSNANINGLITAAGNIISSGNIIGSYFIGDGSQITNLPAGDYSNANVSAFLANYGSNVISATGNITGGNLKTTGLISATGDVTAGNVNAGASIVATSHTGATFSATGNVTGGNINTGGTVTATGNVTGGNIRTVGQVSATGNVTGSYFIGNGSQLTGIAGGAATLSGNLTGNLVGNGYGANALTFVSVTGNVTAGNIIGNVVGSGAGTPTIASTTNLDLSAVTAVRVIGGGTFRLPTLTTAQIANLTAVNGDMVYNSTTTKIQAYANNAWGNITLS